MTANAKNKKSRRSSGLFTVATLVLALPNFTLAAAGEEKYQYDALGRLEKVTYADGKIIQYKYDAAGNRTYSGPEVGLKKAGTGAGASDAQFDMTSSETRVPTENNRR